MCKYCDPESNEIYNVTAEGGDPGTFIKIAVNYGSPIIHAITERSPRIPGHSSIAVSSYAPRFCPVCGRPIKKLD